MKQPNKLNEALWEFPCEHAIKIMGYSQYPLVDIICSTLDEQSTAYCQKSIKCKNSRHGKYTSVTIKVTFNNKKEVEDLFSTLSDRKEVVWAL